MPRCLIALSLVWLACGSPAAAQEQVVTPEYKQDHACWQSVPCDQAQTPCQPGLVIPSPCTPPAPAPPPAIHYEMKSKALFWGGAALAAAGATFIVGAETWWKDSELTSYPSLPCGTDPYFAQHQAIAPCHVNDALLATGVAMAAGGGVMMFVGSQKVAIGADGRQVTVRVRF